MIDRKRHNFIKILIPVFNFYREMAIMKSLDWRSIRDASKEYKFVFLRLVGNSYILSKMMFLLKRKYPSGFVK